MPQDVLDRLASLEREVAQLRGRAQIRPALNQILAGDVVIGEGGQLIAKTPGGQRTFVVGQTLEGDWGIGLAREQGSAALTVGDDVLSDAQMIRMWSRDGEVIVMDDAYADGFLGRPSIPIPMQPTSGRETSSTTETTAWTGATRLMNSVIYASFETYTPAGVIADVSFEDSDGVIESWVASTSAGWTTREITKPVRQKFFDHVNYRLKHSVRSGTGAIRTNCLGIYTRNAFTPQEAP
ncbi:hypothetical protein AB0L28_32700 [Streptomyces sp. NPDC052503]|uniref:hypothetical protein n=1 Tax=Streptomyces sp. NPDC052503 TaxID=3156683 RepID=UPI00342E9594